MCVRREIGYLSVLRFALLLLIVGCAAPKLEADLGIITLPSA
jgi:hypothetical protein